MAWSTALPNVRSSFILQNVLFLIIYKLLSLQSSLIMQWKTWRHQKLLKHPEHPNCGGTVPGRQSAIMVHIHWKNTWLAPFFTKKIALKKTIIQHWFLKKFFRGTFESTVDNLQSVLRFKVILLNNIPVGFVQVLELLLSPQCSLKQNPSMMNTSGSSLLFQ